MSTNSKKYKRVEFLHVRIYSHTSTTSSKNRILGTNIRNYTIILNNQLIHQNQILESEIDIPIYTIIKNNQLYLKELNLIQELERGIPKSTRSRYCNLLILVIRINTHMSTNSKMCMLVEHLQVEKYIPMSTTSSKNHTFL